MRRRSPLNSGDPLDSAILPIRAFSPIVLPPPPASLLARPRKSLIAVLEQIRLERGLRRDAVLVPFAAAVIREASRCRVAFTVIVRDAIAQRRRRDIDLAAMLRVRLFH